MKDKQVSKILELGCGQLNDALWFVQQGFEVSGIDFSQVAIEMARKKVDTEDLTQLTVQCLDFSEYLPFAEGTFDTVFSHYSLHYFDDRTTSHIFAEIHRVLREEGLFIFSVKSIYDLQCGVGHRVGPNMFDDNGDPGHIRHFFCEESLLASLHDFQVLDLCESSVLYAGHDTHGFEVIATACGK